MTGSVDEYGRALLQVQLRTPPSLTSFELDVWIDTGFTGELLLPQAMIDSLGLVPSGSVDAVLADGSRTELRTYTCLIQWFGNDRQLEIIANDGEFPLLGVGLLLGNELRINYHSLELTLDAV